MGTLRSVVFDAVPDAVETIKYRMPTYLCGDHVLCAFASQKHYMSLCIVQTVLDRHREELHGLNLGKNRIRFKRLDKLPPDTVREMLTEVAESIQHL